MYGGVNGHQRYLQTAIETAHPARLVVMLYDGAIRFLHQAQEAMTQRNYEQQNLYLQKTQRILAELISSLDFTKGGEVAENLFRIYTYLYNQLVQANLEDDSTKVQHAITLLSELREAWDAVAAQVETPIQAGTPERVSLHG
ncbi:MAG: flagellar export chaperone FliS [Armatimonadota bacterium]